MVNNAGDWVKNQLKNFFNESAADTRRQCADHTLMFTALNLEPSTPEGGACLMVAEYKSRTQKKKEDRALQRLGEQLVNLPIGLLETMELPDELLAAIELVHNIKSRSAKRRQIQYIGALMRHIDPQPIIAALERIRPAATRK